MSALSWDEIHPNDDENTQPHLVTERALIPGGWLVRVVHVDYQGHLFGVGGLSFVPDPDHKWEVS